MLVGPCPDVGYDSTRCEQHRLIVATVGPSSGHVRPTPVSSGFSGWLSAGQTKAVPPSGHRCRDAGAWQQEGTPPHPSPSPCGPAAPRPNTAARACASLVATRLADPPPPAGLGTTFWESECDDWLAGFGSAAVCHGSWMVAIAQPLGGLSHCGIQRAPSALGSKRGPQGKPMVAPHVGRTEYRPKYGCSVLGIGWRSALWATALARNGGDAADRVGISSIGFPGKPGAEGRPSKSMPALERLPAWLGGKPGAARHERSAWMPTIEAST